MDLLSKTDGRRPMNVAPVGSDVSASVRPPWGNPSHVIITHCWFFARDEILLPPYLRSAQCVQPSVTDTELVHLVHYTWPDVKVGQSQNVYATCCVVATGSGVVNLCFRKSATPLCSRNAPLCSWRHRDRRGDCRLLISQFVRNARAYRIGSWVCDLVGFVGRHPREEIRSTFSYRWGRWHVI